MLIFFKVSLIVYTQQKYKKLLTNLIIGEIVLYLIRKIISTNKNRIFVSIIIWKV